MVTKPSYDQCPTIGCSGEFLHEGRHSTTPLPAPQIEAEPLSPLLLGQGMGEPSESISAPSLTLEEFVAHLRKLYRYNPNPGFLSPSPFVRGINITLDWIEAWMRDERRR